MSIEDKKFCVYKHTNTVNGKVYIGITCRNPKRRWLHGHGYRRNAHFMNAIRKYTWEAFTHEILLEGLSKAEACEKEIELIRYHRSNEPEYGYNLSSGGEFGGTGHTLSAEARQKLSESKRGEKHYLYGKRVPEETRRKMSEAHKGKTHTDEQRRRNSESQRGEKNHNYGKQAPEETRQKMSESHRKYTVVQMDMDGNVIAKYPTTKVAAIAVNGHATSIAAVCRGKKNKTAGFKWKYEPI